MDIELRVFLDFVINNRNFSSGSSGRVGGADKHKIYAAAIQGHLFMTYFLHGGGGGMAPGHSGSATGVLADSWVSFICSSA